MGRTDIYKWLCWMQQGPQKEAVSGRLVVGDEDDWTVGRLALLDSKDLIRIETKHKNSFVVGVGIASSS